MKRYTIILALLLLALVAIPVYADLPSPLTPVPTVETAVPTKTAVPTETPQDTPTPQDTATPQPTETVQPTKTVMPTTTKTVEPTVTVTVMPTETPPSHRDTPTPTVKPTEQATPTQGKERKHENTPTPTFLPTPTEQVVILLPATGEISPAKWMFIVLSGILMAVFIVAMLKELNR